MAILLAIAHAFTQTFGITEPTHEVERRAAYYIAGLLVLLVMVVVASLILFTA